MDSIPSFPSLVPHRALVAIVLAGSITLDPQLVDSIYVYANYLASLNEGNASYQPASVEFVSYDQSHSALLDPVYIDDMITEGVRDVAAPSEYAPVLKIITHYQTRDPNVEFSFVLLHVAAVQHDFWDLIWETLCDELNKRNINTSTILLNSCPIFAKFFSEISLASSHITQWFHTFPANQRPSLPGFTPPATHPAPSVSGTSTIEVRDSPSDSSIYETRCPDNQWAAEYPSETQVPIIVSSSNPYGGPHASSSNAMQSQPQFDISVPETQGLLPIHESAPTHSGGFEQSQLTPHDYTEKNVSPNYFLNANTNTRLRSSRSSDDLKDNEWTGTLNLNGKRVFVRAPKAGAIGNPNLSALPNELHIELAASDLYSPTATLAIQGWIRKNKAPVVRLWYVDESDNCDFDQLVQKIRDHNYAVVKWENRDRLLLAPSGKSLHCALFPEKVTELPTPQPPRPVRVMKYRNPKPKTENSDSQAEKKSKSNAKARTRTRTRTKPYDRRQYRYPEAATEGTTTLQRTEHDNPQTPPMTDPSILEPELVEIFNTCVNTDSYVQT